MHGKNLRYFHAFHKLKYALKQFFLQSSHLKFLYYRIFLAILGHKNLQYGHIPTLIAYYGFQIPKYKKIQIVYYGRQKVGCS